VAELDPDIVAVAVGRWETHDRHVRGSWSHLGKRAFDERLRGELEHAVEVLHARGASVAFFTAPYYQGVERLDGGNWSEDDPDRVDRFNQVLRQVAARHRDVVKVIDVGSVLSPDGRYTRRIDGVAMRTGDGVHVTSDGARRLAVRVLPQLAAIGPRDAALG
jgi:hypothetical protein